MASPNSEKGQWPSILPFPPVKANHVSIAHPAPAPGIYAITPDTGSAAQIADRARPLLGRGLRLLQLRSKHLVANERRALARDLLPDCRAHGTLLIINDSAELAAEVDADGVHLGGEDGAIAEARRLLGPARWIGASCYADPQRAERALADGADYLAFGAFFPSRSKTTPHRADVPLLLRFADCGRPLVAIGGIDAHNGAPLLAAGARWLAVIGALWDQPDPLVALDRLNTLV
jgi:thiamine-phosphate pyrophosphorylase